MKLAVSNIAWKPEESDAAYRLLVELGVAGVELAPTLLYPGWEGFSPKAGRETSRFLTDLGLQVCALQSILFGKPELQVFNPSTHSLLKKHIWSVAAYAEAIGAEVIVFGSPKNRRRGNYSLKRAYEIAVPFVRELGEICGQHGVTLGWEANPADYNCDFVQNLEDCIEFVEAVNHPFVGVHGDTGGMELCGPPYPLPSFKNAKFVHFHASAAMLGPVGNQINTYTPIINSLKEAEYNGWVTIEMKQSPNGLNDVKAAVALLKKLLQ